MWGCVDAGLSPECSLPAVEPAGLWEQRFAASAPLWERSLWLGPKPSARRRYRKRQFQSITQVSQVFSPKMSWPICRCHQQQWHPVSVSLCPHGVHQPELSPLNLGKAASSIPDRNHPQTSMKGNSSSLISSASAKQESLLTHPHLAAKSLLLELLNPAHSASCYKKWHQILPAPKLRRFCLSLQCHQGHRDLSWGWL